MAAPPVSYLPNSYLLPQICLDFTFPPRYSVCCPVAFMLDMHGIAAPPSLAPPIQTAVGPDGRPYSSSYHPLYRMVCCVWPILGFGRRAKMALGESYRWRIIYAGTVGVEPKTFFGAGLARVRCD